MTRTSNDKCLCLVINYFVPKCSSQADFYTVILTFGKSQISVGIGPYWHWSLLALVLIVLGPPYWPWSLEGPSYWPWSLLSCCGSSLWALEMWSGTLCISGSSSSSSTSSGSSSSGSSSRSRSSSSSSSSGSGPADFYTPETACVKINLETLGQGCEDLCSA